MIQQKAKEIMLHLEATIVDNELAALWWTKQLPFANCYSLQAEGCTLAMLRAV